jgi:prepilin-type N-terminal cleavage/methylation domain-containing protein
MIFRQEKGFTLIELLIVIAILAFVSVMAMPRIASISGMAIKSEVRKIGENIRLAFNQTVSRDQIHRLVINIDEGYYKLEYLQPPLDLEPTEEEKEKQKEEEKDVKESPYSAEVQGEFKDDCDYCDKKKLSHGLKFFGVYTYHDQAVVKQGDASFLFFPAGFVEKAFVYLIDDYERIYTIKINQITGGVMITNEYEEPKIE